MPAVLTRREGPPPDRPASREVREECTRRAPRPAAARRGHRRCRVARRHFVEHSRQCASRASCTMTMPATRPIATSIALCPHDEASDLRRLGRQASAGSPARACAAPPTTRTGRRRRARPAVPPARRRRRGSSSAAAARRSAPRSARPTSARRAIGTSGATLFRPFRIAASAVAASARAHGDEQLAERKLPRREIDRRLHGLAERHVADVFHDANDLVTRRRQVRQCVGAPAAAPDVRRIEVQTRAARCPSPMRS